MILLLVGAIAGSLAYFKLGQFEQMAAQGSQQPPPISVTVATAETAGLAAPGCKRDRQPGCVSRASMSPPRILA